MKIIVIYSMRIYHFYTLILEINENFAPLGKNSAIKEGCL